MTADPIKYSYDPEGAQCRFMRRHVFGKWRMVTELFGIAVMLLFLYFAVKIAMREYRDMFVEIHPALLSLAPLVFWGGIVLGLSAAFLCGLLVNRLQDTILEAEKETVVFKQGPIEVTLGAEGVRSSSKHFQQFVTWAAVHKVVTTPQGIGLRLDNRNFVPIPEEQLPTGVTIGDVASAIASWREQAID